MRQNTYFGRLPLFHPPYRRPLFFFFFTGWVALFASLRPGRSTDIPILGFFLFGSWLQAADAVAFQRQSHRRIKALRQLSQKLSKERERQAHRIAQQWKTAAVVESMGYYAASVFHNIAGPISTLNSILPEITHQLSNRQRQDITACLGYVSAVVRHARRHLRREPSQLEEISIASAFEDIRSIVHNMTVYQGTKLSVVCPRNLTLTGDSVLLKQILLNLVQNGLEATAGTRLGTITLRGWQEADTVVITVTDTGPGMPKNQLRRLGQRFFTVKPGHTGLGVSFVQETVRTHFGGKCKYQSVRGEGTTAQVFLPTTHFEE